MQIDLTWRSEYHNRNSISKLRAYTVYECTHPAADLQYTAFTPERMQMEKPKEKARKETRKGVSTIDHVICNFTKSSGLHQHRVCCIHVKGAKNTPICLDWWCCSCLFETRLISPSFSSIFFSLVSPSSLGQIDSLHKLRRKSFSIMNTKLEKERERHRRRFTERANVDE